MKRLTLFLTDLVVFYGSLAAVLLFRYGAHDWQFQYQLHAAPFSFLFLIWLLAFYIANLYETRTLRNGRDFFTQLAQAIVVASFFSVLFFYFIPYFGITPKTNLFLFILVFAILSTAIRALFNKIIAGGSKNRILIVGINDESIELSRFVAENPQLGWSVRALVRLGQEPLPLEKEDIPWPVLSDVSDLLPFIRDERIDLVVISPQAYQNSELITMLSAAIAEHVDFASLASFAELLTGTVPIGAISQRWFLENIAEGSKKSYEVFKRVADVAGSLVIGSLTLVLTPFVALAIKLDSSGPIFFRQMRTGRSGKQFEIIKFRTMRQDAEKITGAVWAQENDPRVTRIGRFLRKTRIDELPQLLNILRGQMSFVGPRAERPEFDERLAGEIPFYNERYLIRPGLSGWAQINYRYGASVDDATRKLEYDLYYLKHRSLALDLEIVLKTLSISLRRAGR